MKNVMSVSVLFAGFETATTPSDLSGQMSMFVDAAGFTRHSQGGIKYRR